MGLCLHFRTSVRLSGTAYLMFPRLNPHFEFDTEFDKTLKNQCFSPFPPHQKSPHTTQKHPSTLVKSTLKSNSIKIFKKSIQIIQKEHQLQPHFTQQKSSIFRNPIIQKSPSHRTHQNSH